jgi:hypothetical protein
MINSAHFLYLNLIILLFFTTYYFLNNIIYSLLITILIVFIIVLSWFVITTIYIYYHPLLPKCICENHKKRYLTLSIIVPGKTFERKCNCGRVFIEEFNNNEPHTIFYIKNELGELSKYAELNHGKWVYFEPFL